MKRNGFTLIELLVAIALILVIGTISVISFNKLTYSIDEADYKDTIEAIEEATDVYISKESNINKNVMRGDKIDVKIGTLIDEGLIGEEVLNKGREKKITRDSFVRVSLNQDYEINYYFFSE